ncbi:MAG: glycosyltransferase [Vicinamibacterales bacterium]
MFVIHLDTASTWRGGQNQALLTAQGIERRGHRVRLAAMAGGELIRRAQGTVETLPLAFRGELDLAAGWQLARLIREERPEVVHAHDPHAVAVAALAGRLAGSGARPVLVASRRVDFHVRGNAFSRLKYREVDLFVAASDAIRRMLIDDGIPEAGVVTVHEGIDVARVQAVEPASVHSAFNLLPGKVVGCIGALVPHKGHRYLIEAAPRVLQHAPDARFIVLGEGELRPALERRIAELGLREHVVLPGFRNDVLALLKSFDVFVMSSVTEGLGTSLLDAMAARRAIVATHAGGIPEVVEDGLTGLLVPPADSAALAASILKLLSDEDLRSRLAREGERRVRERFNVDRMVDATLEAYSLAARRKGRAGSPAQGSGN